MKINSNNELDSGSEDEEEVAGDQLSDGVEKTLADNEEQQSAAVMLAVGEGVAEGLAENVLGECGEEVHAGLAGVESCDKDEVTPLQTTPFFASEIKEEFQSESLVLQEEHSVIAQEQMGTSVNEKLIITPEHFLGQLLGRDHMQSSQRILGDNLEEEVGTGMEVCSEVKAGLTTAGAINHSLVDPAVENIIEVGVSETEQEVEEEAGRRDICPLCAESGQLFSAGQNEMATHFVQVN